MQIESPINPINKIIKKFVEVFIEQHRMLLYKIDYNGEDYGAATFIDSFDVMKQKVESCVRDVQIFREIIQDSIVRFYELQFKGI
jgi:hypothetical protein